MSFPNPGFWMAKGAGNATDGELPYDNSSRVEPKRSHQYIMDGTEAEFNPNKRQAVDGPSPTNHLFSGVLNSNNSLWGNSSSFHSVPSLFTERSFDSEASRAANFGERSMPPASAEKIDMGRKVIDDPFGHDASFGLSMSHTVEEPRPGMNFGGIRKVKVSEVKDTENAISVSTGHPYSRGDNSNMPTLHAFSRVDDSSMSLGTAYNKRGENILSMGEPFVRDDNNFISMGQPYSRGDENISIGQTYKENDTTSYKSVDNTISMGHIYRGAESTISMTHGYKDDNNNLSMGTSYSKGDSGTIISFGGNDDNDANPSERLMCNYDLLMGQPLGQKSDGIIQKDKTNADALSNNIQTSTSGAENSAKKKDEVKSSKKAPLNNFPSNVRSLLSTGIFDGVPVKYTSWSREKELHGVIKGSGYLCGCQSCNLSKVINAYEFERHAGCKTKHPNNHIYFENGKTIYGIVQELRSTPQDMLFDVIQTITGSPINQKSFRLWKESFLAATRELQRIYGKDDGKQL